MRRGVIQKKILLLLLGGLALGLSRSPTRYFRVLKIIAKDWHTIDREALNQAICSLYKSKLVEIKSNKDKTLTLILSKEGQRVALTYNLDTMAIKRPLNWDKKWRIVMFDIPEPLKKVRDSIRYHLKNLNFRELQKSVFVHPFPCSDEIEYLVEFYNIRRYVRFITAVEIDNELAFKKQFGVF
ncbi:MAG: hypothetical protein Q7S34_01930 [bacterium]|nr:hypothetical protein [bacterium]